MKQQDLIKLIEEKIIYKNRPYFFNSTTESSIREDWEKLKEELNPKPKR